MEKADHIAVLGMSFSGSTVLNYCLGSLPGCATINESHWLVDPLPSGGFRSCLSCGPDCAILSMELKQKLVDCDNYYGTISAALGVNVLISSDKNLKIYDRLSPGRNYSAIVLFKDPLYQLHSWRNSMIRNNRDHDCQKFLNSYSNYHSDIIKQQLSGSKYYLYTHEFQTKPEAILFEICKYFELEFDPAALQYWKHIHHCVGGNFVPQNKLVKEGEQAMVVRDLRPAAFPDELVEICHAHTLSQDVYAQLIDLVTPPAPAPPPRR